MRRVEWHGWGNGHGESFHIGPLPGRKSICLYGQKGSVFRTLAFFKTERDAEEALDLIDRVIFGARVPDESGALRPEGG